MNKPLTTKCGHSFCAECIHQVVKGPRSSAQCPLCMTNITRRSLGHNNKITNLVIAVRKIIASIKKDCCFEGVYVKPSVFLFYSIPLSISFPLRFCLLLFLFFFYPQVYFFIFLFIYLFFSSAGPKPG